MRFILRGNASSATMQWGKAPPSGYPGNLFGGGTFKICPAKACLRALFLKILLSPLDP